MNEITESPSPWVMLEADEEVGHLLYGKHRLAHSIQAVSHKNGVALLGGPSPELYSGYGLRNVLSEVLPLLDGEHTLEDIEQHCTGLNPRQIRDVIGNLFMSGLLRTGSATDLQSDMEIYLDRIVGSTGVFRSGKPAAQSLRVARLGIFAPQHVVQRLSSLFAEMGGSTAINITQADDLNQELDLLLVVSVPGGADPAALFERANHLGIPALNLEICAKNARMGPLVLAQISASYACYLAAHPRLTDKSSECDPHVEMFWSTAALHMVVSILTRTIKRPLVNAYVDHVWQSGRQMERRTTIARLHGWDRSGAPTDLGLTCAQPGYEGWKQYCGIALQTQDWHPANSYLIHFKPENILSIFERTPAIFSGTRVSLSKPNHDASHARAELSLPMLSLLARYSAGFQQRDGTARRLVPTGGGLGSTLLLFLVRNVAGLASGCYWFDAYANQLERMKDIDIDATYAWLGADPIAPAVMISFANVSKVARKYGPFSVNISWYDSGVLLAYTSSLTAALGLRLTDRDRPQPDLLMQRLGLPASVLIPTGVLEVATEALDSSVSSATIDELLTRISARRAVRNWPEDVTLNDLDQFWILADRALSRHAQVSGLALDISLLLLLKLSDGQDGFYEYRLGQRLHLIKAYDRKHHNDILSQVKLTEAPIIAFPQIDLGRALTIAGDEGLETAYRAAGAVVGDLWLNSGLLELAGTACGGAFEGRIRSVTGRHGLECFAPLALCLGPAALSQAQALSE